MDKGPIALDPPPIHATTASGNRPVFEVIVL